jgi:hypothetical protein
MCSAEQLQRPPQDRQDLNRISCDFDSTMLMLITNSEDGLAIWQKSGLARAPRKGRRVLGLRLLNQGFSSDNRSTVHAIS